MHHDQTLEERIAEQYGALSGQLQKAADFVIANPLEIASRSLRSISAASDVSPATFSRLSRALGYVSFEEMKDESRSSIEEQVPSFSERAERLRAEGATAQTMLERQGAACVHNIETLVRKTDAQRLEDAATTLRCANHVLLFGALGSTGIVEYMAYLAQYFAPNWSLAGRMGASLGSAMAGLSAGDAVLIVTKTPYVKRAVTVAKLAKQSGADVILVTDMHQCPALAHARYGFIVPSESPQFFSSYAATLVLIETLIAMIVASSEDAATASIREIEDNNRALGEYWAE